MINYKHERSEPKPLTDRPKIAMPPIRESLWMMMKFYLNDRGLDFSLAKLNYWYPTRDESGTERIVIPCSNAEMLVYYQARAMVAHHIRYDSPAASRLSSVVLVRPRNKPRGAVVVEGPMDALAAAGAGFLGIGLMGNVPNMAVLKFALMLIGDLTPVIVVPDQDSALFGANVVGVFAQEGKISSTRIPPKKDLAEMSADERLAFLTGRKKRKTHVRKS